MEPAGFHIDDSFDNEARKAMVRGKEEATVIVIDDSSDEDADERHASGKARSIRIKRPSELGEASRWRGRLEIAKSYVEKEEKKLRKIKGRRQEQEERDRDVARRLQKTQEDKAEATTGRPRVVLSKEEALKSLEPCQLQAINYVKEKAKDVHTCALPRLEERATALGFSQESLQQCLDYIRDDAPIIIHLTYDTLAMLKRDTHYRSLFETKTSGGCEDLASRECWEKSMFGSAYVRCKPFNRPKYGCLNITGDIAGVKSAREYGPLYMILHQHVRYRATFFDNDTGNTFDTVSGKSLATNEFYAHVLMGYEDGDLTAALGVCATRVRGAASACSFYKEVQIHGPVCLETDIQALSIPGKEKEATQEVQAHVQDFQKIANCNILWQGDLLDG